MTTGFFEVTQPNGNKALISVGRIFAITVAVDSDRYKTLIESEKGSLIPCKESYDEIKAIIRRILSPAPEVKVNSVKCSGNGMAFGTFNGDLTIDHRARTTMHQNASSVVNIKHVDTLKS